MKNKIFYIFTFLISICCNEKNNYHSEHENDKNLNFEYFEPDFNEIYSEDIQEITLKPLKAGISQNLMPVPIGIPTSGFFQNYDYKNKTPFSENYPGTKKMWLPLKIKAIYLEGNEGEIIIVKLDTIGILSSIREHILLKLKEKTGKNFNDNLIIAATHTHSGPGRMAQGSYWEIFQDKFFPEFYEKFIEFIVKTILDAINDSEPIKIGFGVGINHEIHEDRRCENPELEDPTLLVIKLDKLDGTTKAIIINYPIHGTVLPPNELTLSQDAPGAIERKIEEKFNYPIMSLFLNSYAGDMAPKDPMSNTNTEQNNFPYLYKFILAVGESAAKTVIDILDKIEMKEELKIKSKTFWIPLNRDVIGYKNDEFPYPYGAYLCGGAAKNCLPSPPIPNLDKKCISFKESDPAPQKTLITIVKLDEFMMITFPGECTTPLGLSIVDSVKSLTYSKYIYFIGYAQDYIGYVVAENEWFQGGYEAAMTLWGPKLGLYLQEKIIEITNYLTYEKNVNFQEPEPTNIYKYSYIKYTPTTSKIFGKITKQPLENYKHGENIVLEFLGGDPWLGTPNIVLYKKNENGLFEPFIRNNKTKLTEDGYEMVIELIPDPPYPESFDLKERNFIWRITFFTKFPIGTNNEPLIGTFKFYIKGKAYQNNNTQDFEFYSNEFIIN